MRGTAAYSVLARASWHVAAHEDAVQLAVGVGGCEWYRERTLLGPRGWSEHSRAPTRAPTRRYRLRRRPLCAQVRRPAKALDDMPVRQEFGPRSIVFGRTDGLTALGHSEPNPGVRIRTPAESSNQGGIFESQPNHGARLKWALNFLAHLKQNSAESPSRD